MSTRMEIYELLQRLWSNLLDRPSGPLAFRFLLQPTMSAALAIRDGVRDARQQSTPYLWAIVFDARSRMKLLQEGVIATSKVLCLAIALDLIYQRSVLDSFHFEEAVIVAITLGFIPYLLIRGPVARLTRLMRGTTVRDREALND
jgi:hypothetical protein